MRKSQDFKLLQELGTVYFYVAAVAQHIVILLLSFFDFLCELLVTDNFGALKKLN